MLRRREAKLAGAADSFLSSSTLWRDFNKSRIFQHVAFTDAYGTCKASTWSGTEEFQKFIATSTSGKITLRVAPVLSELNDYRTADAKVVTITLNTQGDRQPKITIEKAEPIKKNLIQAMRASTLRVGNATTGYVPQAALLTYTARDGEWYYVNHEGSLGWIDAQSVRVIP